MKKLIIALSVAFSLNACYNINKSEIIPPEKIIPKQELIEILTDLQLIEAGFTMSENRIYVGKVKPKYYQAVLDKHDLTLGQLRENVNYYQATPKVMEEIYESVLANLSKIQSDVLIKAERLEKLQDSIDNLPDSLKIDTVLFEKRVDTIPDYLKKK